MYTLLKKDVVLNIITRNGRIIAGKSYKNEVVDRKYKGKRWLDDGQYILLNANEENEIVDIKDMS